MGEGIVKIIALCEEGLDDVEPNPQDPSTLSASERQLVTDVHRQRWGSLPADATVRGSVIRSLCVHADELAGGQLGVLKINGGTVIGPLDLAGLRLDLGLRFHGTHFKGDLVLKDTRLVSIELHGGSAGEIAADRVEVAHDVVLSGGFMCRGSLWLRSSNIGGDLNLMGASFIAPAHQPSIQFDGAHIGRRFFAGQDQKFHANHGVYGRNARIGGGLLCRNARFDRELNLTRAEIKGIARLQDAVVGGAMTNEAERKSTALHLDGLIVTGDLDLRGTRVGANRVLLRRVRLGGRLAWGLRGLPERGNRPLTVDLKQAQVRMLDDPDLSSWDGLEVALDGFDFDAVAIPHTPEWRRHRRELPSLISQPAWLWRRLEWLNQQPEGRWSPYPYDQLRLALLNSGEESAARETAIRRERVRHDRGGMGWLSKRGNAIYGLLLGYGYKPARFFVVSALVVLLFFAFYQSTLTACDPGARNPTCGSFAVPEAGAPPFRPMMFSLDAFVPIDLNQTAAWVPANALFSYLVALETALGWLLTGLLLGAVTGILRRD
jgi:hypothetical protein